jgi:uncharacterized protein (TIGR03790 family)
MKEAGLTIFLRRCFSMIFAVTSGLFAPTFCRAEKDLDAQATLVVYNRADPLSQDLARFYAGKRNIPVEQVVGITCSLSEEISRQQFDDHIAEPLRKIFDETGWWKKREQSGQTLVVQNRIRFIALMRGIPVKIMQTSLYPGDIPQGPHPISEHNEAAVDSELATLGYFNRNISGALRNPYYRRFTKFRDSNLAHVMLVCRLDGPTGQTVRKMIDDSVKVELIGVWGFGYIDTRNLTSDNLKLGDEWLENIGQDMRTHGIPVVQSHGQRLFPKGYPMRNAAFYYGWYSGDVTGPFEDPSFRFNPGAVAVHIHSFSAAMIRNPASGWVAPLLARGAAATTGNVYEPYLGLTPNLDILHERLRNGFNFAEACYMSEKVLSWMNTFVGDPLYRPFKFFEDLESSPPPSAREWWAFREGAMDYYSGDRVRAAENLREVGRRLESGIIFEGLASILAADKEPEEALRASRIARRYYRDPGDIMRVALREANMLAGMNRYPDALKLLNECRTLYPGLPATPVVIELKSELEREMPR